MNGKLKVEGRSCVWDMDTGRLGRAAGQGPLWLHPRWVSMGLSRVSAVASVFLVVGWGLGAATGGCRSHCPLPLLSQRNPCGERQKHNQKCSSTKKDTMVLG